QRNPRAVTYRGVERRETQLVRHAALGDFQHDLATMPVESALRRRVRERAATQYLRWHVDADRGLGMRGQPVAELALDGFHHPVCQHPRERRLVDGGDEVRREHGATVPAPARECLASDASAVLQRHDRKVFEMELARRESGTDLLDGDL